MRDTLRDRQQWGTEAMVSTGSSAATLAAVDVLREGGTAFDAAIAASAVLTVAMPMASGPAGDAAAVFHVAGSPKAWSLTGLGRAPSKATRESFLARGRPTVPNRGIESATTPGLLGAWCALRERLGTMPWSRLLAPAVALAERGTVVTTQMARWIQDNIGVLAQPELTSLYAPHATDAAVGSRLPQPGLAALYRLLASSVDRLEEELDASVCRLSEQLGGFFAEGDCAVRVGEIAPAVTARVGGFDVATNPAPTQGMLLLQNLVLYERLGGGTGAASSAGVHLLSEIVHQTYAWRIENLGDPVVADVADPLAESVLRDLGSRVDPSQRSATRYAGHYSHGDTTHFGIVDRAGNSVSWTQSLGLGFGAGVGVADLGLLLCDRLGRSATLDAGQRNGVAPGRRPVNTIFAWSASDCDAVRWLGGTPGGDGQCQWNAQVIAGLLVDGVSVLEVLNRPRWTYLPGADKQEAKQRPHLQVDSSMPENVRDWLRSAGHTLRVRASVGGALRVLCRNERSVYGLDDGRQEGLTVGL